MRIGTGIRCLEAARLPCTGRRHRHLRPSTVTGRRASAAQCRKPGRPSQPTCTKILKVTRKWRIQGAFKQRQTADCSRLQPPGRADGQLHRRTAAWSERQTAVDGHCALSSGVCRSCLSGFWSRCRVMRVSPHGMSHVSWPAAPTGCGRDRLCLAAACRCLSAACQRSFRH
ncbi:hypothetical protein BC831DRAFT_5733 [Entophlyctis helioformis]|nr:hypothetical protein BC831DRAFT_5733 [Entophlyctis helioformis]